MVHLIKEKQIIKTDVDNNQKSSDKQLIMPFMFIIFLFVMFISLYQNYCHTTGKYNDITQRKCKLHMIINIINTLFILTGLQLVTQIL